MIAAKAALIEWQKKSSRQARGQAEGCHALLPVH
jgi:hypothetical protein